jgi:ribosomal protein S18 acetylase RimI-like enzyme
MTRLLDRFKKLGRRLGTFRRVGVLIAEHHKTVEVDAPVTIVPVDAARVADARTMDSDARIEEFRAFLKRGDRGFYAYRDHQVVNRAWVMVGPGSCDLWHGYGRLVIPAGSAYVHYCETAATARGLGIYPAVLAHVARALKEESIRTVRISTTENNLASLRGIARAGYRIVRRVEIRIVAGFGVQSSRVQHAGSSDGTGS